MESLLERDNELQQRRRRPDLMMATKDTFATAG